MKVLTPDEATAQMSQPDTTYSTGRRRSRAVVPDTPLPDGVHVGVVAFEAGSRTHLHVHEGGQILVIVSGECVAGDAGGDVHAAPEGSVVIAEPGELHWHGAGEDAPMTHVAITLGATEWFGPGA